MLDFSTIGNFTEVKKHKIKNHDTRISYAVNALKGKHRWALSGVSLSSPVWQVIQLIRVDTNHEQLRR